MSARGVIPMCLQSSTVMATLTRTDAHARDHRGRRRDGDVHPHRALDGEPLLRQPGAQGCDGQPRLVEPSSRPGPFMSEGFGARLRAERERRHISLAAIATSTTVHAALFEGLARDAVSRWPARV